MHYVVRAKILYVAIRGTVLFGNKYPSADPLLGASLFLVPDSYVQTFVILATLTVIAITLKSGLLQESRVALVLLARS